jgi:excisionase family DNA binding protein
VSPEVTDDDALKRAVDAWEQSNEAAMAVLRELLRHQAGSRPVGSADEDRGADGVAGASDRRAFSCNELSEAWGVSRTTINKLLRTGELRAFRVGRRLLIPREQVQEFERRKLGEDGW